MTKLPLVVDTCIFSYEFNQHSLAERYVQYLEKYECFLSFQTVAELYRGAAQRNWGEHKKEKIRRTIAEKYTTVHSDDSIVAWFVFVMTVRKKQPIAAGDAWIAATALALGCPIVTHNAKDFESIPGLTVITEYI
ncbi:MAG: PIN domain-containing protein [Planctomycetaceae bacterium]|jgi:predicted nucleic acid-binding protein|nr:PIN domain-containing protein [Planctomycetaceae bacterium]